MKSVMCLLLLVLFFIPLASATDVHFDPSAVATDSGAVFNVTIWVIPTQEVDTVATNTISWNADALTCLSVAHGNLFNATTIWLPGTINNLKGTIVNSIWASSQPTSTAGTYLVLSFRAKSSANIVINTSGCGIARNGTDIIKTVYNTCVVMVDGGSVIPVVNDQMTIFIIIFCVAIFFLIILVILFRRKKE